MWFEGRSNWLSFEELTPVQQKAVLQSTKNILPLQGVRNSGRWQQHLTDYARSPSDFFQFTVELIPTQTLINRFAEWGWTENFLDSHAWRRIQKIMKSPRWPYVSFLASNFKSLSEPFFHGDGFHRAWAAHFNDEPYIEVVYARRIK